MATTQQSPREAKLMAVLLNSLGVANHHPNVVPMLMEFAHRYAMEICEDALMYAGHSARTDPELADVKLAIQAKVNYSFTPPPQKEFLLELADEVNKEPLPELSEQYGLRLPKDDYRLTQSNFQIVPDGAQHE
jgi:transcription initiation factor TFIID subunit 9B